MRQTELHLGVEERKLVESYRRKGQHAAREVNRAHILAALDEGLPESQIMAVLGIGRTAIWRTRAAYLEGGVAYAIHDLKRPGRPCQYGADVQAQVSALACSTPPEGARRWTLDLLGEAARALEGVGPISRETIRRSLKKTVSNLGVN
jgi:hypothetical protein